MNKHCVMVFKYNTSLMGRDSEINVVESLRASNSRPLVLSRPNINYNIFLIYLGRIEGRLITRPSFDMHGEVEILFLL